MFDQSQKKLLFLSSLGGVLEFYDFIIYALFAAYIAHNFFPTGNDTSSLLATFATFSVGYVVRPLGGIVFGHFGDKIGRKRVFTFSILMMATATFLIALVPPYSHIGLAAPIILTILRVFQGLSVGGEIPGAIAYVSESIPESRGFACGIIFFGLILGIVLGSLFDAILQSSLSAAAMLSWGWRLPFFIGGVFGFMSYLMRRQLKESRLFADIQLKFENFPLFAVFRFRAANALFATFVVGLGSSIITLLFLFTPSYLSQVLHIKSSNYLWYQTLAIFFAALFCIASGWLADRASHKKLLLLVGIITLLFAAPIFIIYADYFACYGFALLMSAILTGFAWGVIPSMLAGLFPTAIRYSGVAISYNLGFAIFGGLTPVISMSLIYKTGFAIAPIFYLMLTALLALFSLMFIKPSDLGEV